MNKSKTLVWYDDYNPESYLLCMQHYGLKLLLDKKIDSCSTEITVYGQPENLDKFLADLDEGDIEPLDTKSAGIEYDDDYEAWLANEICNVKVLFDMA